MGNRHSLVEVWPDRLLAVVACTMIRCYQRFIARRLGRVCLFHPTCSQRALVFFRESDFWTAIRQVRQQLDKCRGDYSIRLDGNGDMELITGSGLVIKEAEVNPELVEQIRFLQQFAASL